MNAWSKSAFAVSLVRSSCFSKSLKCESNSEGFCLSTVLQSANFEFFAMEINRMLAIMRTLKIGKNEGSEIKQKPAVDNHLSS